MVEPNDPVMVHDLPDEALGMRERRAEAARARLRRCRALGRPTDAEVARMVAEFHARGGKVTVCAPVYLVPVNNGVGRDAALWAA